MRPAGIYGYLVGCFCRGERSSLSGIARFARGRSSRAATSHGSDSPRDGFSRGKIRSESYATARHAHGQNAPSHARQLFRPVSPDVSEMSRAGSPARARARDARFCSSTAVTRIFARDAASSRFATAITLQAGRQAASEVAPAVIVNSKRS